MKNFIKHIIIFLIPISILLAAFEYSVRQIPNQYSFKEKLMEEKAGEAKTIIIGSSVADFGIFPAYLGDSAYNFAVSGEWLRFNEMAFMRHIDKMVHVKNVFWGIFYTVLWRDECNKGTLVDDNATRDNDIKIAMEQIYRDYQVSNNPLHHFEIAQSLTTAADKWLKYHLRHESTMLCDSLGYDHLYSLKRRDSIFKNNSWKDDYRKKIEYNSVLLDKPISQQVYAMNCQRIERVASECEKRGINLYLTLVPTHPLYYNNLPKKQDSLMHETLNGICARHSNVKLLDYSRDTRMNNDSCFFDLNHLCDVGAKKFTLILRNEVLNRP